MRATAGRGYSKKELAPGSVVRDAGTTELFCSAGVAAALPAVRFA